MGGSRSQWIDRGIIALAVAFLLNGTGLYDVALGALGLDPRWEIVVFVALSAAFAAVVALGQRGALR